MKTGKAHKKRPQERREGSKVYRDGKMFWSYAVHDDGRINMHQFAPRLATLTIDELAIHDMERSFSDLVLRYRRELRKRSEELWSDIRSELAIIDPSFDDPANWKLSINKDGMLTKERVPPPEAEEAAKSHG